MTHDMKPLIELCLGSFLYSGTAVFIFVLLVTHILKPRKSPWILVVQSFLKIVIVEMILGNVVPFFFEMDGWILMIRMAITTFFLVGNYLALYWVLEGGFLRVALAAIISELTTVCVVFSVMGVLRYATGRKLWSFETVQYIDLLLPVICAGITYVFWKIGKPFLIHLRTCKLPYPKLLWACLFVYLGCAFLSVFQDYTNLFVSVMLGIVLYYVVLLLTAVCCMKYYQILKQQKEYLRARKRILDRNYSCVCKQMEQMKQYHAVISQQMDEMQGWDGKKQSQNVRKYLEQLKEIYQETHVGIYCNDWEVDAILRMQNKKYLEKQMDFDCYMQEYHRGSIEETDVVQIIFILTNYGMNAKKIQLHMAKVKNQLVVKFVLEGQKEGKKELLSLNKQLLGILKKYEGEMTRIEGEKEITYIILLDRKNLFFAKYYKITVDFAKNKKS